MVETVSEQPATTAVNIRPAVDDQTTLAAQRHYSAQVLEHYLRPRNVGRLSPTDPDVGTGEAGEPEQGGVIRMQLRVDTSGIIKETRFKAYGCGATIAAASWCSEWLLGKTLDQPGSLEPSDLIAALSLPPVKTHCAILAHEAALAAVHDYRQKQE